MLLYYAEHTYKETTIARKKDININGGDVQRKNVVNNVDKSSLWAP